MPELSQSHLAQYQNALSLLRQHLPDKGRRALAHRGIQANAPARSTLGTQLSVIRRTLSIYQRHCGWGIEYSFRDTKDPHFGMGMGQIRINSPERRNHLWLLNALAVALLTLLGAAGEALGFDKHLKASTTKRRVHSLFRQGCLHYQLMPTMPETRLQPLMEKFVELMREQPLLVNIYGLV
jgi:hypothetical protein